MADIRRVWIEEGCISCSLCQDICPEVFEVEDGEDCVIKGDAGKHFAAKAEDIREAACDCPVEVIQLSEDAAGGENADENDDDPNRASVGETEPPRGTGSG